MRLVGARVHRVEDPRILTGRGRYVDDVSLPGMLHATFVRSPIAHARITGIDTAAARALPGVVAVVTAADFEGVCALIEIQGAKFFGMRAPTFPILTGDKVRHVGDIVAMVVAESRYLAEDGAELVDVSYDPLAPVVDYATALDPDSPPVFDELESNVIASTSHSFGDVDAAFAAADRVLEVTLVQHRVANVPMETRGAIADFDPGRGELTYRSATQSPHGVRMQLATVLGLPVSSVRVLAGDIGGAFGLKGGMFREDYCLAAVSRMLGRPVKWIEDRQEHLTASGHAREETVDAQIAIRDDGTLLGLKVQMIMDTGAYPWVPYPAPLFAAIARRVLPGPYRLQGYSFDFTGVSTNKATYVAYRGPWEIETWVRERILDVVAHELGLDPADVRRLNMFDGDPGDQMVTGLGLEGVSSRESLDRALDLIGYEELRRDQAAAREAGRCIGIGFATFIEGAPGPPEMRANGGGTGGETARVRLEPDGHITVITSQSPHGQSHETTLAQLAADEMGVPFEHVRVVHGDTNVTPYSPIGTGGSKAGTWASGAVIVTTRRLREMVLEAAASMLEIAVDDLEIVDGTVVPKGVPEKSLPLAQIAMRALTAPMTLAPGTERELVAQETFTGEGITGSGWSGGTHACAIEIDLGTGKVSFLRYVVVEDCGRVVNPDVVEGQVRGGIAQGIGEVLYEHAAYDEAGNPIASTFLDYLVPTAMEIPTIEIEHLESDPDGEFGFRGVGEGGAIVAPATLTNAIEDALLPFGGQVREMYLPPARVLELAGLIARPDAPRPVTETED